MEVGPQIQLHEDIHYERDLALNSKYLHFSCWIRKKCDVGFPTMAMP